MTQTVDRLAKLAALMFVVTLVWTLVDFSVYRLASTLLLLSSAVGFARVARRARRGGAR